MESGKDWVDKRLWKVVLNAMFEKETGKLGMPMLDKNLSVKQFAHKNQPPSVCMERRFFCSFSECYNRVGEPSHPYW